MADMSYFDSRPKVFEEIAEQVSDRVIDAEAIQFITCESIIEIDRYIGLPIFKKSQQVILVLVLIANVCMKKT